LRPVFFTRSAALGKILTLDNLRKQRVIVIDKCCMCKRDVESVDYFLLHCDVASALGCLGLCLDGLSTCLRVGGPLEGLGVLRGGKWCPLAFFGLFGGR
jgi:hypothetical protein